MVYYNEFNPEAAKWLRQLVQNGDIAPGFVDDRSILDVSAPELEGFAQHHFFAGIGVWSYALRGAGWPDDRPVCTASLPCQPFSVAGNRKGKNDERHLLPHFLELVHKCGFNTIFGEQVESAIKHGWLDDLQTNMEREGYAVGHSVLGAHSVNAAHKRQRLYWVANYGLSNPINSRYRDTKQREHGEENSAEIIHGEEIFKSGVPRGVGTDVYAPRVGMGYSGGERLQGHGGPKQINGPERREATKRHLSTTSNGRMGESNSDRRESGGKTSKTSRYRSSVDSTGGVDWLYCKDGKYRPIKSGLEPLVNGLARGVVYSGGSIDANNTGLARTMRLKGYGNAINADVAQEFIRAFMEVTKR